MKQIKKILSIMLSAAMTAAFLEGIPSTAAAANTETILRVGLTVSDASTFSEPKLENVADAGIGYTIGTMNGTAFSGSKTITNTQLTIRLVSDAFQVSDTATGEVLYTSAAGADHLAIHPASSLTWFKGYKWNGDFVYRRASDGNITVINYVELEDYVKGVLPYEIDPDWPAEAQKAQAVCARSFALGTHKHTDNGYDLCNTTNCQVYLGANKATDASDAAVDSTAGEYLTYDGNAVIGYFFSSDGGATEDAANVWGGEYPYLKGKTDPYETHNDSWSVTLTADEIRQTLTNAGYSIGTVASVQITKRTDTGNVNEVVVTDTDGNTVTLQRANVRTVFGLKSIRYSITPNAASAALVKTSLRITSSTHKVTAYGKAVSPQGYNINGNNYYKLRDLAYILSGTESRFNVTWNAEGQCIELASNQAYETVGGEMTSAETTAVKNCSPSSAAITLDGNVISLTGYNINGNNYYKVRDVGSALGFPVDFADNTVMIGSASKEDEPDEAVSAASYTFNGTGWGHSVGMSQWGAYAMAQQGFDYQTILKFYFTGISISG